MKWLNLLLILPFLAAFSCLEKVEEAAAKPNVLFIAVDDLRPELGAYGKSYVKSPHIDRLAKDGLLFRNHFVNMPTCGASRYSLLSGKWPRSLTGLRNTAIQELIASKKEGPEPESFVHQFRKNDYYTVGIGKITHYVDGKIMPQNKKEVKGWELPNSWDEMLLDVGKWGSSWGVFFGYADGSNRNDKEKEVKPYEAADVEDEGYPDGLTANLAIRKLRELKDKKQPFFLGVGFFKPHLPFNAPKKYWDLYEPNEIPLSPNPGIPENIHLSSLHESGEFNQYKLGEEKNSLEKPLSDQYARKLRHAYLACVSYTDALIGKVLHALEEEGLADNTIVVLWGDHGWHLGDQRVWGKHTLFDRALKSPLIIRLPGGKQGGKEFDQVVSTTDIYPTLMDLCGLESPKGLDGRELATLWTDEQPQWESHAWSYFRKGISLRTDRYRISKYFREQEPQIELYDHEADPYEQVNIAAENAVRVDSLLQLLEKGNTGLYD
ncbi:MAG: sulfatase [Bacteroidia bacterium]|nr:sulfatase [Bacteroidia bacterium]